MQRFCRADYFDHPGLWLLGQVTRQTINAAPALNQDFDQGTALPITVRRFGLLEKTLNYHSDGNLATSTDGRGNTIRYDHYKRGLPQQVSYPTGASESADVNDLGNITRVTDAAGYTSHYGYDAIGRLSSITPPSGWAATSIEFEPVAYEEFGLGADHWRQTISHGQAREITYYDALWRPVMTRSWDEANEAGTRSVLVKQYDAEGRATFEGYVQRDVSHLQALQPGVRKQYDALGRLTRVEAASELGTSVSSTDYLPGFQTRETNARGHSSTKSFWALDTVEDALLAAQTLPEGANLSITRDLFGKATAITRNGNAGGYSASVTRSYVYDQAQRLCKTVEPEVGSTVQDYDAAGNVAWRAPGLSLPNPHSCDTSQAPPARKISYGYSELNQLTHTSYGDGSPDITRSYTPDGLLAGISSDGAYWTLGYNALRLPTRETLSFGSKNYEFSRGYNTLGQQNALVYPSGGPVLTYQPDAMGRATAVGAYASNVSYHANGAVASYTLGNGIAHSRSLNLRGLPELNRDAGVISDRYSYDANGNVSAIADEQEGVFGRSMSYDGLDRLLSANAPGVWGNASYEYDPVDNLRRATLGSRSTTMGLDSANRLSSVNHNGSLLAYGYDASGNITSRGSQQYQFDLGNRLRSAASKASYRYDGSGRRTLIENPDGSKQLQLYSPVDGKLLFAENTAGQLPATVTGYSCPAGQTLSDSSCISTTTTPATVASYSCPSGYTLSGSNCTRTAYTTVPATISGYSCPNGGTVSGSQCQSTVTQAASIASYSCPSGYTLSGSTCSYTTTSTSGATASYSCPAGQTLSGTNCVSTSTTAATAHYSCPSGYTLGSGNMCSGTRSTPASSVPDCKDQGTLQNGYCTTRNFYAPPGDDPPESLCGNIAESLGLTYHSIVATSPKNYYRCYIGPAYVYSCPAGSTLSYGSCLTPESVAATLSHYSCPDGQSLSGSSCTATSTSAAHISYSCPDGQTLSGNSCTATSTDTQPGTPNYSCPNGYSLSGSTCSTTVSSDATPNYSCSPGYTLSGTNCTTSTTDTVAGTPNYSCPAGQTLSGSSCTATSSQAATPIYGCPGGGTLQGSQCVGGTSSTTAYVYLGSKLLAEHDSVSGLIYTHTDVLGSPVARSNAQGSVLNRSRYEPYGAVAHGFTPNRPFSSGFTGHVNDADTGLVYMQQRYYDSIAGRFLSVDPVVTDANTGKGFGLYTYVDNNPYAKVDPDGRVGELFWTASDKATLTIKYTMTGVASPVSAAAINAQVAADFSGSTSIGGKTVTITAQGVNVSAAGPGVNTINVVKDTAGVTASGRSETNAIGGSNVTIGATGPNAANVRTVSHELGHAVGAGDQYKGGVGASGATLGADVAGPANVMKDLSGQPANKQTLGEIIKAPTNTNSCAKGVSAASGAC